MWNTPSPKNKMNLSGHNFNTSPHWMDNNCRQNAKMPDSDWPEPAQDKEWIYHDIEK